MDTLPFDALVTRHGATVLRVCRSVLAEHDADDAWSETFLAALRAYPALPADANHEAWLVRIAQRKVLDGLRAARRRPVTVAEVPEGTEDHGWQPPDDDLWDRLRALPPRQRQAVAYHHVAGLPYAEVAALVGGTAAAVRRAAADGVAALRRSYPAAPLPTDPQPLQEEA